MAVKLKRGTDKGMNLQTTRERESLDKWILKPLFTLPRNYSCSQCLHPLTRGAAAAPVGAVVGASGVAVMGLVVGYGGWHWAVTSSVAVWW